MDVKQNTRRFARRAFDHLLMAPMLRPGNYGVGYYMKFLSAKEKEDIKHLKDKDLQDRLK